jgi:hypothetical protein
LPGPMLERRRRRSAAVPYADGPGRRDGGVSAEAIDTPVGVELETDMDNWRRTVEDKDVGGGPRPSPADRVAAARAAEADVEAVRLDMVLGPGERAPVREYAEGESIPGDMGLLVLVRLTLRLAMAGPFVDDARALREGGRGTASARLGWRVDCVRPERDGGRDVVGSVDRASEDEVVGMVELGVGVPTVWREAASVINGDGMPGREGRPREVVAVDALETAREA